MSMEHGRIHDDDPASFSSQKVKQLPCSQGNPFGFVWFITQVPNPSDNKQGSFMPIEGGGQDRIDKDLWELHI